jgi:hypothetical protein
MIANRKSRSVKHGFLILFAPLLLAGCSRAPSFDVLGSFFPAWLVCLIAAILLAAGTRFLLLEAHLEEALSPPIVMYPCLAALFTFGLWLLFFH